MAGRNSRGFSQILPGFSTVYLPGLNFSREAPSTRSTYQSTPPPWHSHNSFFLESPLLKIGTFFHSDRSHLNKLHSWEGPTPAENYTFSQKPSAFWIGEKKQPRPPTPPPHKNIVLCLQSPPPPHIFFIWNNSCCVLVCKNICVCVCLNIFSETTGPTEAKFYVEPPWDRGRKFIQMAQVIYCSSLLSTSEGRGLLAGILP